METPRRYTPDLIRASATVLVVLLHAGMDPGREFNLGWWIDAGLMSLTRVSVPLFVMLSGWLLLVKTDDRHPRAFVTHRLLKIGLPYLVWSAAWLGWDCHIYKQDLSWSRVGKAIFEGNGHYHLWFFPMIIGLYLVTPLLRLVRQHASPLLLSYFVALWLFAITVPGVLSHAAGIHPQIDFTMVSGYSGYFMAGSILGQPLPIDKRFTYGAWAALFIGWLVTLLGTRLVTLPGGGVNELFWGFLKPNVAMMSLAAFYLLVKRGQKIEAQGIAPRYAGVTQWLSATSIGIYILHPAVLEACWLGKFSPFLAAADWPKPLAVVVHAGLAIALCGLVTKGLQSVRWLRPIVP